MPNEYARSGFHSGETASGYFDESLGIFFNGTGFDRKNSVIIDSLEITERQGESINECVMDVTDNYGAVFQDVAIYNGGYAVGVPLFVGNVLRREFIQAHLNVLPIYRLNCADQGWLIDYHTPVTASYVNQGISTIVGDILYRFTEGGFHPGYLPSSLGNLTITFEHERVTDCLKRIALAAGNATLRIGYDRRVSIFTTSDDEANSVSLTDSSGGFWDFQYIEDGSQIATRVIREGNGSQTSGVTAVGATTIAVDEVGRFLSTGGTARSGTNFITYTGFTPNTVPGSSGPGTLTGVSGVTVAIPQGDTVSVYHQNDATGFQIALAGDLVGSGSFTGIATLYVADTSVSISECIARANGDVIAYRSKLKTITFTTTNPYVRCGKTVTVNLSSAGAPNDTIVVQEVRITGRREMTGATTLLVDRHVTASPTRREFSDALITAGVV